MLHKLISNGVVIGFLIVWAFTQISKIIYKKKSKKPYKYFPQLAAMVIGLPVVFGLYKLKLLEQDLLGAIWDYITVIAFAIGLHGGAEALFKTVILKTKSHHK